VELGLGQVILQFASHEWAHLSLDERGNLVGNHDALSRLVSLGAIAFRWYMVGSLLVMLVLGFGGYFFFFHAHQSDIAWVLPWFAL